MPLNLAVIVVKLMINVLIGKFDFSKIPFHEIYYLLHNAFIQKFSRKIYIYETIFSIQVTKINPAIEFQNLGIFFLGQFTLIEEIKIFHDRNFSNLFKRNFVIVKVMSNITVKSLLIF